MDCSLPGSSVHGILQARTLEWVTIPFSRGSSRPRDRTWVFYIAARFSTTERLLPREGQNSQSWGWTTRVCRAVRRCRGRIQPPCLRLVFDWGRGSPLKMPLRQPGEHSDWRVADGWSSDGGDPSSAASCGHCLVKVCVALQFTTCVFITVSSFSYLSYLVEYLLSSPCFKCEKKLT